MTEGRRKPRPASPARAGQSQPPATMQPGSLEANADTPCTLPQPGTPVDAAHLQRLKRSAARRKPPPTKIKPCSDDPQT